jgi:hypothetical protein
LTLRPLRLCGEPNLVQLRDLLFNKTPGFAWRGVAAPSKTWGFIGILFYGKPLISFAILRIA